MFPHTITIYHHDIVGNTETYTKQIVSGVYVQEQYGITKSGHGQQNSRSITITTNKSLSDEFGKSWQLCDGDKVPSGAHLARVCVVLFDEIQLERIHAQVVGPPAVLQRFADFFQRVQKAVPVKLVRVRYARVVEFSQRPVCAFL